MSEEKIMTAKSKIEGIQFTPRSVREAEDKVKSPIVGVLDGRLSGIVALIEKAMRIEEQDADRLVQEYLNESDDNDTQSLLLLLATRLEKQGFLSRKLSIVEDIKAEMAEMLEVAQDGKLARALRAQERRERRENATLVRTGKKAK